MSSVRYPMSREGGLLTIQYRFSYVYQSLGLPHQDVELLPPGQSSKL